jgi:hypothetical protein
MLGGDPEAVRRIGTIVVDLSREHGMALWLAFGEVLSSWARARLGDRESGMTGLRDAAAVGASWVICERNVPEAPKLKTASCPVFSLNSAAICFAGSVKLAATATLV